MCVCVCIRAARLIYFCVIPGCGLDPLWQCSFVIHTALCVYVCAVMVSLSGSGRDRY